VPLAPVPVPGAVYQSGDPDLGGDLTGISWDTIPNRQATSAQQLAEQYNICARSTSLVDTAAGQILRATITPEQLKGPGSTRFQMDGCNASVILSRSPVLSVTGGQVAPAIPPLQWTPIPADMIVIDSPPLGLYGTGVPSDAGEYGQSVTVGGGYIPFWSGRNSCFLQLTYVNGWPHCSLTADSAAGATSVSVDDCTGWGPPAGSPAGAAGTVYDPGGSGYQESAAVLSASAASGPGTLTLATGLTWPHTAGIIFSALPGQLHWASILFGVSQALTRGATATTVQTISPSGAKTSDGAEGLHKHACGLVHAYKRIW
jgi:hypothetical protein